MIDGLTPGETTPGPRVEATHDDWRFTAPLAATSDAVVGVIANLALFFAAQSFRPGGPGGFDAAAALIAPAAAAAPMRSGYAPVGVIGACAAAGLAWQMLR